MATLTCTNVCLHSRTPLCIACAGMPSAPAPRQRGDARCLVPLIMGTMMALPIVRH